MASVLQEIYEWSKDRPQWQSDAIRRLVENGVLTAEDLTELTELAITEGTDQKLPGLAARPLGEEQIPAAIPPGDRIRLLEMKSLQHVNAIASAYPLRFEREGLTVVYGDNGAGKSGYSRVLKRACRARDQKEPVLPNAAVSEDKRGKPQATFVVEINGKAQELVWGEGNTLPPALSAIAVFDNRCARVYLDQEHDVAFAPYGLDIPTKLAAACDEVRNRIERRADGLVYRPDAYKDLAGDHVVGRALLRLPAQISAEEIKALATLSSDDEARLAALQEVMKQGDPAAQARLLRSFKGRLEAAAAKSAVVHKALCAETVSRAIEADLSWRVAKRAADHAAQILSRDGDLLQGTGGNEWRILFDAAREFSEKCAYPGHHFPNTDAGARCPLCQQELKDGSEKLRRFGEFVKDKAEQEERSKAEQRLKWLKAYSDNVELAGTLLDAQSLEELARHDERVANGCVAEPTARNARLNKILTAFDTGIWDDVQGSYDSLEQTLNSLVQGIDAQIKACDEAAKGERAKLEVELRALQSRKALAARQDAVLTVISDEKQRAQLSEKAKTINTRAISLQATELAKKAITEDLARALNDEFVEIEASHLHVVLEASSPKGQPKQKLRLNIPSAFDLERILSEGEQRAIALASFLAEATIAPNSQGIVFDDPVSSLDHIRREVVARRLAKESKKRQVIVFTHDLYFLNVLLHEAGALAVKPLVQTVQRGPDGPGEAIEDIPFEGKGTKARIGQMKDLQLKAAAARKSGDDVVMKALVRDGYRMLRDSWERAVEEVLLNNSITRFKKSIETNRLLKVTIEPQDLAEIEKGMTKCSNYSHDRPLMAGIAVPSPDEFLADVTLLVQFRARVNKRMNP